jgi:hypothetical protein
VHGRAICSGCDLARQGYDRLRPRRVEFVPLWRIAAYFELVQRRREAADR